MIKVLKGGTVDGEFLGTPTWADIDAPLGKIIKVVNGTTTSEYVVEETDRGEGNLLGSGLYANKTTQNILVEEAQDSLALGGETAAQWDNKIDTVENSILPTIQQFGVGTEWENLVDGFTYSYGFETNYNGNKYAIKNPVDEVTVAPPTLAGRTYNNFGSGSIGLPAITLVSGDVVEFDFLAYDLESRQRLIDGVAGQAFVVEFYNGNYAVPSNVANSYVDGVLVDSATPLPDDNLTHHYRGEFFGSISTITSIGSVRDLTSLKYKGIISNFKVYNSQGQLKNSFPLRSDAVDYKAGNLVKDEEFTNPDNFYLDNTTVSNQRASIVNGYITTEVEGGLIAGKSYRILADVTYNSGSVTLASITADSQTTVEDFVTKSSGNFDEIIVPTLNAPRVGIKAFSGDVEIKNLRVIENDDLCPSPDFSSSVGFTLSGVTIDTTAKKAVFGSDAGIKSIVFDVGNRKVGDKVRVVYSVSNRTTGRVRVQSQDESKATVQPWVNSDGKSEFTIEVTQEHDFRLLLVTVDGFDGDIDSLSVTDVTDGIESGTMNKSFESYWKQGFVQDSVGIELRSYTLSTLPSAQANPRKSIWVSDATGGAVPVYSNGTDWLLYSSDTLVS